jgi:exodeoxyribonuclease VII large subunit
MSVAENRANTPPVWAIGALVRAIADALQARFNPVAVQGEISGFSRAASGHCYFTLKDDSGQIRCAMFRRAAMLLDFPVRDGLQVELRGRLDVYGPRGDLQLIVESMRQAGAGALFEQFLRLKAKLEAEGLFETARKRELPAAPRGIGIVTSLGAAALADVATALQRRVPHIPVVLANASVQGANASSELIRALSNLYLLTQSVQDLEPDSPYNNLKPTIDVILLVRGGGSMEDLAAFNDEALARCIAQSPVPVVSGVGHETDFSIADFVADLRAPTPTAAAELAASPREGWLDALDALEDRLQAAQQRFLELHQQWLDNAAARLGRPARMLSGLQARLQAQSQRLSFATSRAVTDQRRLLMAVTGALPVALQRGLALKKHQIERHAIGLAGVDPHLVLQRGYAWLTDDAGHAVTRVARTHRGQALRAVLSDGTLDLTVASSLGPDQSLLL